MMLERLIYKALVDGIEAAKKEPAIVEKFFCEEALLSQDEARKIRDFFLENPPNVIHGYARKDAKFPLYAITLTSQNQGEGFIGDEGGYHDDEDDPNFGSDDWAAIFSYTYNIICYSQHPDITLYYFHLLQAFIIAAEPLFKLTGHVFDVNFSGADMVPDVATQPAGLWARRFQIEMKRQYTQTVLGSKLGRARRVQGIHIDHEGAAGESVGDVTTKVFIGDDDA